MPTESKRTRGDKRTIEARWIEAGRKVVLLLFCGHEISIGCGSVETMNDVLGRFKVGQEMECGLCRTESLES